MESLLAELPEWARGVFYIVLAVGGAILFLHSKSKSAPPALSPSMASIGMELGNKEQTERLVAAVVRIGDILADKKQHEMDDKLDELLERMSHMPDPHR